jgi:hypothetical protein
VACRVVNVERRIKTATRSSYIYNSKSFVQMRGSGWIAGSMQIITDIGVACILMLNSPSTPHLKEVFHGNEKAD